MDYPATINFPKDKRARNNEECSGWSLVQATDSFTSFDIEELYPGSGATSCSSLPRKTLKITHRRHLISSLTAVMKLGLSMWLSSTMTMAWN